MRLRLGSSSLMFKPEKIRLNSKLSVKIVRRQVYERTESSFAYCGFFGSVLFCLLVLEWLKGKIFSLLSFSLCCRFDLHRVLFFSIRPLRRGYFYRLIQNKAKGVLFNSYLLCCRFNRTVYYIFLSVRSAGGTFVDWYKSTQKIALSTPHLEPEFPFCGGKRKISASDAATPVSSADLTFQKHQSAIIFKPHSVMVFSQMKPKRPFSDFLFSADFLRWIYMFCLDFFIFKTFNIQVSISGKVHT